MKAQRIAFVVIVTATTSLQTLRSNPISEPSEHSCTATTRAIASLQQQALRHHTACESLLGVRPDVARTILSARDGDTERVSSHPERTQTGLSTLPRSQSPEWQTALALAFAAFVFCCLFFPAAAPLAGRILAALINRAPGLAGPVGLVSVEAFDALIKAIELNGSSRVRRLRFGVYTVQSATTAATYTVTVMGTDYRCTCPAGLHGKACWHKAAVLIAKTEQSGRARVVKPAQAGTQLPIGSPPVRLAPRRVALV